MQNSINDTSESHEAIALSTEVVIAAPSAPNATGMGNRYIQEDSDASSLIDDEGEVESLDDLPSDISFDIVGFLCEEGSDDSQVSNELDYADGNEGSGTDSEGGGEARASDDSSATSEEGYYGGSEDDDNDEASQSSSTIAD